jgi:hypothetical protein
VLVWLAENVQQSVLSIDGILRDLQASFTPEQLSALRLLFTLPSIEKDFLTVPPGGDGEFPIILKDCHSHRQPLPSLKRSHMLDKSERLLILLTYLRSRKAVGHTQAMIKGVANSDNVIVLASHEQFGYEVSRQCGKKVDCVSWNNVEVGLFGKKSPIAIDNSAMLEILEDALEVIRDLRQENSRLNSTVKNISGVSE